MATNSSSAKRRKNHLDRIDEAIFLEKRRKQLYNKKFRKSCLFRSAWVVRVIYLILGFVAVVFHEYPEVFSEEVVRDTSLNTFEMRTRFGGVQEVKKLSFTTDNGEYLTTAVDAWLPTLSVNDTLLIQHNPFGKATYFSKRGWYYKFPIDINYVYYVVVLLLSLVSMGFNDGLDRFARPILLVALLVHLAAIVIYLLT